jgi:hypothetical protein
VGTSHCSPPSLLLAAGSPSPTRRNLGPPDLSPALRAHLRLLGS